MKYKDYLKAKDYSMNKVVPAFRKVQNKFPIDERNIYYKYAETLAYCGTQKNIDICEGCGTAYFSGANMCRNRFCPVCQKQKSLVLFSRVYPKIIELLRLGLYVNVMTFTIKDTSSLENGLYLLKTAYRNISGGNKIYRFIYSKMFIGGIRSLEVKRGKNSKEWHPHIHALVIKDKYSKDQELLNYIWNKEIRRIVNTSDKTIYEDRIYTNNENLGNVWIASLKDYNRQGKVKAVYECLKYITKYGDEELANDLEELVHNLRNIHSVDSWGLLRGIEKETEDENLSLVEIKNKICKKCGSVEFATLCGITLEELSKLGITELEDFENTE